MLFRPFRGKGGEGSSAVLSKKQSESKVSPLSSLRSRNYSLHVSFARPHSPLSLSLDNLSHTKPDRCCFVYRVSSSSAKNTATRARSSSPYELRSLYDWTYAKIPRRRQVFLRRLDGRYIRATTRRLLFTTTRNQQKHVPASARNQFWTRHRNLLFSPTGKSNFPR